MKNFLAILLNKLLAQKLSAVLISLSPILTGGFLTAHSYFAQYLADPTGRTGVLVSALAIALAPLPFASYYWFKPKLKFDEKTGTNIDMKTSFRYCHNCKHTIKQNVQLKTKEQGWYCIVCKRNFHSTSYSTQKFYVPN